MRFLYQRKDNKHRIKKHPGSVMTIIPSCIGTETSSLVCDFTMLLYLNDPLWSLLVSEATIAFTSPQKEGLTFDTHRENILGLEHTCAGSHVLCCSCIQEAYLEYCILPWTRPYTTSIFFKWGYPRSMSRACGSTERGMESCPGAVSRTRRIGLVALP